MSQVICISGIDTDIGKTVATGLLARALMADGKSVITQKVVQTGCSGIAEDITVHRRIMGLPIQDADKSGLTCSYVFKKPCSPHLAGELSGVSILPGVIADASRELGQQYEYILLEGAGGLMVPLTSDMTFLDYLQEQRLPLILVSSPRLGSINHTLSALELAQRRGIEVRGLVYNIYGEYDFEILDDSRKVFKRALIHYGFAPSIVDMVALTDYKDKQSSLDFLSLLQQSMNKGS